uniref:non-specific serine/threonine protein kinase n=1 Tax=Oryza barthii TaxID=65489 RepID=A0A0D3G0C6_9ORYZ
MALSVLLLLLAAVAQAQKAPTATTDPNEAEALNDVFAKLGQKAAASWNTTGDPCSGTATDGTDINDSSINPAIKCDCSDQNNTVCHITGLNLSKNLLKGPIPPFIGELTAMQYMGIGSNSFSGFLPSELGNLFKLEQLYIDSAGLSGPLPSSWASDNNFTGQIPDYIGGWNLTDLRFQGNNFHGPLPATLSNLVQLTNLVLRNCRISDNLASINFSNFSNLTLLDLSFNNITGLVPQTLLNLNSLNYLKPSKLKGTFTYKFVFGGKQFCDRQIQQCLAFGTGVPSAKYNLFSWSTFPFAVNCGGYRSMTDSENIYQTDDASLGPASYYVKNTSSPIWVVSNVGKFMDASDRNYTIFSGSQSQNTLASELFQSARVSPSSLRYYGIGLENGNYTGERKEQNFDIRNAVGGKSNTAIKKDYIIHVTKNIIEIHLFWAGKGTCCIPYEGFYGPSISALSVTPMDLMSDFTPGAHNAAQKNSSSKKGVIVGVVTGVTVLGLVALAAIFMWMQKRRKLSLEQQELYSIVGRPNVFSYGELRSGTENFSSSNLLGEGGYGVVYKGNLIDGRIVAVKQLSQSSHQGKRQFATEIETISRVQHRNLVKLYGCCLEGNNPLLVYEYMENGSLDKALFGSRRLNLDWATRFEIFLGIARGLAYLHEESRIRVVHRDIKASNVLLDTNLNPKISDFGLAKLYDDKTTHVSTKVAGTFGYLAPEYAMRGHMTEKVDVFAFGVVLLETLAGRPNYDDALEEDKVWRLYESDRALDIVDPDLTEFNSEEVLRAIHVALLCTQGSPHRRPSMSRVVAMLTGDAELGEVAAKPSYITEWQIKGGGTTTTGSSSTSSSAANGQWSSAPPPPRATSSPKMSSPFLSSVVDEGRGGEVSRRKMGWRMAVSRLLHGCVLVLLLAAAVVQAQRAATRTDPTEAAALNAVFAKLGQQAQSSWNLSGDPCTGRATDGSAIDDTSFNPAITCDCTFQNSTICRITKLKIYAVDASGQIPEELRNLTRLTDLTFGINSLSGPIPKELGNLTNLISLYIDSAGLSGPLPSSLSKLTRMQILWASDNNFTGQIPDYIGSWNLTDLRFQGNSFQGPIPAALSNLVQLSSLQIGDIENGSSSSLAFISNMTSLSILILRNCRISDDLASLDFSKFASLSLLDLSFNNITGEVPATLLGLNSLNFLKPSNLKRIFTFNFYLTFRAGMPSEKYTLLSWFSTLYETDGVNLRAASYYVTGAPTWGVSNVGKFMDAPNGSYIIYSSRQFQNTLDSELFQTSRMSPSSLRYYGIGLENGNYTVTLQFAEFGIEDTQSWKSLGRRVFDIYVQVGSCLAYKLFIYLSYNQGERKEKNFDIRKTAGDKSYTVVKKQYKVPVTKNFLEIHLFWAGKGTCCIPTQGYYGPTISALSVLPLTTNHGPKMDFLGSIFAYLCKIPFSLFNLTSVLGSDFTPTVGNTAQKNKSTSKTELYSIVGRPNVFSYSELRSATENFSSSNRLGEGGYGAVYKGKLTDGRVVAVKQLSQTSHQGKKQFATEIETISRVQHRNLVKLYGCCLEGNNPLLVYEYMENGSLDKALFGTEKLTIDWPERFEICLGIARGLAYLHEESSIRVVHRDIKASNVLIDANLNPKISDFGLAKLYDDKKTHVSTKVAGTFGYLAPEYAMRGHMTEKVDVFAFGVVLLETLAGRPNYDDTLEEDKIYIFEWAWELYENNNPLGLVDPKLKEFNREEVLRAIRVALLCTQGSPHQRPPMSRVVSMLAGDVEVPDVLTKPSYITEWQIKGGNTSFANSAVSGQSSSAPGSTSEQQGSSLFLNSVIPEGRGDPCTGAATDGTDFSDQNTTAIKCDCSDQNNTVCHITRLKIYARDAVGQIPEELQNLKHLTHLNLSQNVLAGPIPSFIGELTNMQYMTFGINALSGPIPKELGNLTNLISLGFGSNNFSGSLPSELGNLFKLEELYIDSAGLSGALPSSFANLTRMKILWASDNNFTGQIPDYIGSWNLTDLRLQGNSFQGPLPATLSNLVQLTNLRIGDIASGISSSLAFISSMTSLNTLILRNCMISNSLESIDFSKYASLTLLDFSFNNITGPIPQALLNLNSLNYLYGLSFFPSLFLGIEGLFVYLANACKFCMIRFLGNNSLTGKLPTSIGQIFLTTSFQDISLLGNLVANNFVDNELNNSILPSMQYLNCLQRSTPCFLGSPKTASFAVNCGGPLTSGSDNLRYQSDEVNLGDASYYITGEPTWGVSTVGRFMDASNGGYTIRSSRQFQNTLDTEMFQNTRTSASSLRYYGIGLENGNYTVTLQFAEFGFEDTQSWKSLGRRVFDIYLQGERKEQNFDIRKAAGDKSYTVVKRSYKVPVTKNFVEIHLFWAGKGTCCIPTQDNYGPSISALSLIPADFTPTVSTSISPEGNNNTSKAGVSTSKAGVIVGVVVGVTILGLIALAAILIWRQNRRKRKLSLEQQELYSIVGRPNVISYGELRSATENFSSSNLLGEGGYGAVYKGKLTDGRVVAVKQLSQTSHQGKVQFAAEIQTISRVQHRNLVKLYGCCLESNNPLLVYEYMDNGSLDKALFGTGKLNIDWPARFGICLGIARGLAYLHEESSIRVVHRDIKASNVLLDAYLNPKISDFGLAKLYDDKKTHVSTKVAGTFGYLAPEYAMRGRLTEKVDVFAFGVVLLETLAGRPNYDDALEEDKIYIFEWAWELYENNYPLGVVDPRLTEYNGEEALRAIRVALLCTQGSPHQRPSMSRVVTMLAGDVEVPEVVTKPSYITEWQIKGGNTSFMGSDVSWRSSSAPREIISPQDSSPFLSSVE